MRAGAHVEAQRLRYERAQFKAMDQWAGIHLVCRWTLRKIAHGLRRKYGPSWKEFKFPASEPGQSISWPVSFRRGS